jgi:hypothetical protein
MKTTKMSKNKRKGQSLTEYLILTALIGAGSIAVVQLLGSNLQVGLGKVSEAVRGKKRTDLDGEALKKDHYSIKDLGDFNSKFQDNEAKDE